VSRSGTRSTTASRWRGECRDRTRPPRSSAIPTARAQTRLPGGEYEHLEEDGTCAEPRVVVRLVIDDGAARVRPAASTWAR
jgi:hypothetical protein